jgi:hypothetical protein
VDAGDPAGSWLDRLFNAGPGNGPGQRLVVAGHLQVVDLVVRAEYRRSYWLTVLR